MKRSLLFCIISVIVMTTNAQVYNFAGIKSDSIVVDNYSQRSTCVLDGVTIPSVNYTSKNKRGDTTAVVIKGMENLIIKYSDKASSNGHQNILMFAEQFMQAHFKKVSLVFTNIQIGSIIELSVSAKGETAAIFSSTGASADVNNMSSINKIDNINDYVTLKYIATETNVEIQNDDGGFRITTAKVSQTYSENIIYWDFRDSVLTISGTGDMKNYSNTTSRPWNSYASSIKKVIIKDGVTSIGDNAFSGCSSLTSVTIPNSVTSIGNSVFSGCSGLTSPIYNAHIFFYMPASYSGSYTIPDGIISIADIAFSNCSNLTSVTIPNSVTSMGGSAFYGCSGLTSITISNSITSIGDYAFYGCSSLASVTIPNSVTSIGDYAFYGCSGLTSVTIGNSVTSIGKWAFFGCSGLTSITIPNSVTTIGYCAFKGCSSMTSVILSDNVTTIGGNYLLGGCFSGCSSLTSPVYNSHIFAYMPTSYSGVYTIPSGIKIIASCAFYGCSNLISVNIPNSVTSIGAAAFYGCSNLTTITIPNSVTSIGGWAFSGCSNLASVTIPNSVTSIEEHTFSGCSNLASVTIPNSVTSIGNIAFSGCSSLTSVTIPNSVTSIGDNAFSGCSGLTSVTIGNSVTSIGGYAFFGCSGLTSVTLNSNAAASKTYTTNSNLRHIFGEQVKEYVLGDDIRNIGDYAFYNCSSLTSLTMGKGIIGVGRDAFSGCNGLTKVNISDISAWCNISFSSLSANPLLYAHHLYLNEQEITDLIIPDNATSINNYAFAGCNALASATIGKGVTSIGINPFLNCNGITSVTINSNAIASKTYSSSANLQHIFGEQVKEYIIGVDVATIGDYAFYGSNSMTSVTIGNNVTSIGNDAFFGCNNLSKVNIYDLAAWCEMSFNDNPLKFSHHLYLNDIEVIKLIIPNGVTSISNSAFEDCIGITSVVIPNSVTTIGTDAFKGLHEMEEITLGKAVEHIDDNAFEDCKRVIDIYCYAERVPDVIGDPFRNVSRKAYLWVPENRVRNYNTDTYWSEFDVKAATAEETNTDQVIVTPHDNTADVVWPAVENADTYELNIKDKDGNIICTLIFNSNGQLTSIAFHAPARTPQQAQTTGFAFTVTGLSEASRYSISIEAKDISNATLQTFRKVFYTVGATIEQFTVVFQDWDGRMINTQKVNDGEAAIAPADPIREGYSFTGWDKDFSIVEDDMTITAQYEVIENALEDLFAEQRLEEVLQNQETRIYTLQGIEVTAMRDRLQEGVYIFRLGNKAGKATINRK